LTVSDAVIIAIIVGCLLIAGLIYAIYLADPPLIKIPSIALKPTVKEKTDPELVEEFQINPSKKVRMYVSLKDNTTIEELEKQGIKVIQKGKYVNYCVVEGDYETLQKLVNNDKVVKVLKDGKVRAINFKILGRVELKQDLGWNLRAIKADIAHENGYLGDGAVVAVLDTGVNYKLPELASNYLGGYDCAYDDPDPMDVDGHGTACASIIVGNGTEYKGVAPHAKFYAVKVLNDQGWGNLSDVVEGLEWCLDQINHGKRIDVISMSFGADTGAPEVKQLLDILYSKGVILVGASGNEGKKVSLYPAAYDSVISVGAVDSLGNVAEFSNGGAYVSAPGVQVPVLDTNGRIYYGSGTSFACPHVSGVLLLVRAEKNITPAQAFDLLSKSTDEINDPDDKVLYGEINAVKAINAALNANLSENRNWYDYLKDPVVQILVGLTLLVAFFKLKLWREGS